jgi:hypothetical protein
MTSNISVKAHPSAAGTRGKAHSVNPMSFVEHWRAPVELFGAGKDRERL